MKHLRLALRTLFRTPFVTAVAVLSLAPGIGANAAIFSIFNQMLLDSLPVQEPGRLVNLSSPGPKQGCTSCGNAGDCEHVFSYPMFRDLQSMQAIHGAARWDYFVKHLMGAEPGLTVTGGFRSAPAV